MSLVEINLVTKSLHESRQLQSRVLLLVAKLSRHGNSATSHAHNESSQPQARASSLLLMPLLDEVQELLLTTSTHTGASMSELEEQSEHLQHVVGNLRAKYATAA